MFEEASKQPYGGEGGPLAGPDQESLSRRRFLTRAIFAIGGFIGGVLTLPAVAHTISPALKEGSQTWLEIGQASAFLVDQPKKVDFIVYKQDGWIEEPSAKSCWVVKKSDAEFVVYDPRCTHLGCPFSWHADKKQFLCPCHTGIFTIDGTVTSGPPPRPLRRFANKLEGGKLLVREEVINA